MQAIANAGRGLVIYDIRRAGIGLMAKLQAYDFSIPALIRSRRIMLLGFRCDYRDFDYRLRSCATSASNWFAFSHSPRKASALAESGIEVVARLACEAAPNPHSFAYLRLRRRKWATR